MSRSSTESAHEFLALGPLDREKESWEGADRRDGHFAPEESVVCDALYFRFGTMMPAE
jgi:hypothetical protein